MKRRRTLPGLVTIIALAAGGTVALWMGWRVVARSLVPPVQLPGLISGGLAGLALLGAACALLDIQADRRDAAARADEIDALLDEVAELAAAMRRRREGR